MRCRWNLSLELRVKESIPAMGIFRNRRSLEQRAVLNMEAADQAVERVQRAGHCRRQTRNYDRIYNLCPTDH